MLHDMLYLARLELSVIRLFTLYYFTFLAFEPDTQDGFPGFGLWPALRSLCNMHMHSFVQTYRMTTLLWCSWSCQVLNLNIFFSCWLIRCSKWVRDVALNLNTYCISHITSVVYSSNILEKKGVAKELTQIVLSPWPFILGNNIRSNLDMEIHPMTNYLKESNHEL